MYPCVFGQLTFGPTFLFVHGQQPYGVEMILVDYNWKKWNLFARLSCYTNDLVVLNVISSALHENYMFGTLLAFRC